MAKRTSYAPPKPLYTDGGYTGILFFTLIAIVVGIGLLAWECSEDYGWNSEGTGTPQVQTVKSLVDAEKKSEANPPAPPAPPMGP